MKQILTIEEVSKKLRVSKKTVLREIKRGKLKPHRAGRRYLIDEDALINYLHTPVKNENVLESFLNSHRDEMISTLQKMVSMPTISSRDKDEYKLALFIKKVLDKWNIRNVLYKTDKTVALKATVGFGEKGILLDAPLDTTPPGDFTHWSYPPFEGVITGGKMYGRGTADCKGGIVSILYSLLFLKQHINESGFRVEAIFDGDEQDGGFLGIKEILKNHLPVDYAIVSYAGDGRDILIGARGYHRYKFTAHGVSVHTGSRFKPGVNAIIKMVKLVDSIEKVNLPSSKHPLFSFGSRKTFSLIAGGTAINIVPSDCQASLDIRTTPEINKDFLDKKFKEAVAIIEKTDKDFKVDIKYLSGSEAYCVNPEGKLPAALKESITKVYGKTPGHMASGPAHIGNILSEYKIPSLIWGPVGDNIHSYDEYVEVSSIPATTNVYVNTILKYFGEKVGA